MQTYAGLILGLGLLGNAAALSVPTYRSTDLTNGSAPPGYEWQAPTANDSS
jgi:hypothetical protein